MAACIVMGFMFVFISILFYVRFKVLQRSNASHILRAVEHVPHAQHHLAFDRRALHSGLVFRVMVMFRVMFIFTFGNTLDALAAVTHVRHT